MKEIAIFGAGGFGREVATLIRAINEAQPAEDERYRMIGYFDDGVPAGTQVSVFGTVLGNIDDLNAWTTPLNVCIAIGSPRALRAVRERITNPLVSFPNLIHPYTGYAAPETFKIGQGNIILGGCWMSTDMVIGDFNVFNGDIIFGHDDEIGNYNVIMSSCRISGEVHIGDGNLIGVGSIVLQQLKIGSNVTLGAGAVLLTKPKDGGTYIGNPAKLFKF